MIEILMTHRVCCLPYKMKSFDLNIKTLTITCQKIILLDDDDVCKCLNASIFPRDLKDGLE